jgi:predicted nucleic acid-binding protein
VKLSRKVVRRIRKLDTNIFVYAFDRTAPGKTRRALKSIRHAVDTGDGIVSYQVVQEFCNGAGADCRQLQPAIPEGHVPLHRNCFRFSAPLPT